MSVRPSTTSALGAIGNTPCVELRHVVPPDSARVFVKLESLNPTGSYKDRMAQSVIEEAERRGDLRRGMTVVEATGGSTVSSLAFVCAVKGYAFRVVSSDAFAAEKLNTMTAFGADLDLVPSGTGKITPRLIPAMRERARHIAAQGDGHDYYYADQFSNPDVFPGYEALGRERWPGCRRAVLEPASAPALTQGHGGEHSVEGIGIGFPPPLLNRDWYDEARAIDEAEGRAMCRRLAREEGLLLGTSSGLNVVAAMQLAKELEPGKTVVTVGCDTGLKYVRGDLYTQS
ncbi:PLP-dependent cysteine synthase family protein [Aspergillus fijiensis CBS 313.89]|uniref:Cysteine synthase A n=1 Tax=Aspergillus fijiensis CBS 313.89 TaxID=1448319 RepID=A0A8G1W1Q7_9EURO|nr:cysteine synthase A [Aspergillus fijiensis CBS 313.89]RAK81210.1 cysteine synthase A [Aspergillus fijiensis CBS 313.89]